MMRHSKEALESLRAIPLFSGVKGEDLERIADTGAQGALLATALHDGGITENEIAAFLRRRRSQT